ncbi:MAG TPA: hypothetical protein DEO85_14880, partial [Maritimibacter sp.]|nr:hypothetical protein [Maritimibacter sp.]
MWHANAIPPKVVSYSGFPASHFLSTAFTHKRCHFFVRSRFLDMRSPPHLFTLTVMAGVSALSMNVFLPALPEMAVYYETDYRLIQLSVALYLAMNAVLQIFLGPISDHFGRRPVMLISFALYLVATIGCVFAPTVGIFLAFRMMQAVVVTGMVLSRAVIRDMVEGP